MFQIQRVIHPNGDHIGHIINAAKIGIVPGDKVFYYNAAKNSSVLVLYNTVESKEAVTKTETTFVMDGEKVSGQYMIGKAETAKVYHKLGAILAILTSQWGFMFLIIFPTLFAIIYEIMMIVALSKTKNDE